ncbi:MAG: acetylxylan esterase, partial [Dyadobacter sp.]
MKKKFLLTHFFLWLTTLAIHAQPVRRPIEVIVTTDHDDWTYKTGEKVQYTIYVMRNGNLVKNASIRYEIGLEKLD